MGSSVTFLDYAEQLFPIHIIFPWTDSCICVPSPFVAVSLRKCSRTQLHWDFRPSDKAVDEPTDGGFLCSLEAFALLTSDNTFVWNVSANSVYPDDPIKFPFWPAFKSFHSISITVTWHEHCYVQICDLFGQPSSLLFLICKGRGNLVC